MNHPCGVRPRRPSASLYGGATSESHSEFAAMSMCTLQTLLYPMHPLLDVIVVFAKED